MKITVIFDNLGPYHLARLRAAAQVCDLTAVEVAASSAEYSWQREAQLTLASPLPAPRSPLSIVTLLEAGTSRKVSDSELGQKLIAALVAAQPDVVFIPGWSSRAAFAALHWCRQNRVPVVAMSESTEWDEKRSPLKEWIKRQIVGMCSAALAGGAPHRDYLVKLGIAREQIFLGYDAVDNGYFEGKAAAVKTERSEVRGQRSEYGGRRTPYFLASARFIEKKNLPRLIKAYALYRKVQGAWSVEPEDRGQRSEVRGQKTEDGSRKSGLWPLILLGDGALRSALVSQIEGLGLTDSIQMPGFVQYPELPEYYARAGVFIHASTTEQWGLVVNEAMASGLPVLVSNRCGCAADLVQSGVNGFTFDPFNVEELAQLMFRVGSMAPEARSQLGHASRGIIADWGTDRFASGLKQAADTARALGPKRASLVQRGLLKILMKR